MAIWWHESDLEDMMGQMCVGIDWVSEGGVNQVFLPFYLSCERTKNTDIDLHHRVVPDHSTGWQAGWSIDSCMHSIPLPTPEPPLLLQLRVISFEKEIVWSSHAQCKAGPRSVLSFCINQI